MTDELLLEAAIEFRAERAADLGRQFVEHLYAAYQSDDPFDWLKAGSTFKRFKAAAIAAQVSDACFEYFPPLKNEMH